MSILDALKVQKSNQDSIKELALLNQDVIVRLAQTGDIPAYVFPVVLNEKARMAQQQANLQAAMNQQQPPQTVIEKAMQTNAQAEVPQGVPSLQTPQMFQKSNFQSGGIVAFNGEGDSFVRGDDSEFVEDSATGLRVLPEDAMGVPVKFQSEPAKSLADIIKETQDAMRLYEKPTPERDALLKAMQQPGRDLEQDKWMRIIEGGLAVAGGQSPYALQNLGRASEALRGYGQDVQAARQEQMNRLKMAADIAEQQRGEQRGLVQTGIQRYDAELERRRKEADARQALIREQMRARRAAEDRASRERIEEEKRKTDLRRAEIMANKARQSDMLAYGDNYLESRQAEGDQRDPKIILNEGYQRYLQSRPQVTAAAQTAIAAGSQGVTSQGQTYTNIREISEEVDKQMKPGGTLDRELRKENNRRKEQGLAPIPAERFRQDRINDRLRASNLTPAGASPAPARPSGSPQAQGQPAQPRVAGLPEGAVITNTVVPGRGREVRDRSGNVIGYIQ